MKYPSIDEYLAAMQAHAKTVRDPLLAAGAVEMGRWGTPLARSGTFALTFKITASGRDYAFRCFQRDRAGMHRRYTAIHKALNRAPLPYFVDFAYLDPGIAVNGQQYPAIRMDWAQGEPLGAFIEANLRDTGRLRALLQQLHGMALALESAGIAHGDVQSNNILVAPTGELKLVDYDGMYVPGIASMGALETGHRNFQHPQRERQNPFDANLDRFSFALLHTAVSALIENPSTWTQLKADPEALLLRASDFADPARSSAFDALTKMPATGPAFQRLRDICARPYQSIPSFADLLASQQAPKLTATSRDSPSWTPGPGSSVPESHATRRTPTSTGPSESYHSPQPVLDALRPEALPAMLGTEVELIGQVAAVHRGFTGANLPYLHLTLGVDAPCSPRVLIWAKGVSALRSAGVNTDDDWNGHWVSATGILSFQAHPPAGLLHVVAVERASQLERLSPLQARWRLTTHAPAHVDIRTSQRLTTTPRLPLTPTTRNERLIISLDRGHNELARKAPTTANPTRASHGLPPPPTPIPPATPNSGRSEEKVLLWILAGVAGVAAFVGAVSSCSP